MPKVDSQAPKRGVGQPTTYRPEYCDLVVQTGAEGRTIIQMVVDCKTNRVTFNDWRRANPEFDKAVKEGLTLAQAWWEEQGRQGTMGKIPGFQSTAYIFQMKNRFRQDWNDRVTVEGSIETRQTLDLSKLSGDELLALTNMLQPKMLEGPIIEGEVVSVPQDE